jgi:class 3 adenylate cyclase
MPGADLESMSLQELIGLKDQVGRILKARFERPLALIFTDVVGSTRYVSTHGDVAGRELLRRHHDLLDHALARTSGRVVDRAGDGAFCVADDVADGARILERFQRLVLEDNRGLPRQDRLEVRSGLHAGPVLVDDKHVSGEAVHIAARIMGTAGAGEIRISDAAFRDLPVARRLLCRRLPPQAVKGVAEPLELMLLDWRDTSRFPTVIEIVECGTVELIPYQGRVSIGRLATHEGLAANDIVLVHPDPVLGQRISRWHAELEMTLDGYVLSAKSRAGTEVDGLSIQEGESAPIRPGSTVRLGNVLTLRFQGPGSMQGPNTMGTMHGG